MEGLATLGLAFEIIDAAWTSVAGQYHYYRIQTASPAIKDLAFHSSSPTFPDIRGEMLGLRQFQKGTGILVILKVMLQLLGLLCNVQRRSYYRK